MPNERAQHEISHSKMLANGDPVAAWGWNTPAGRLRAERRAEMIAKAVGLSPDMCVLEVGCGTGMFTEIFSQYGARIIAVDISPDLIEKARARNLPSSQVRFLVKQFEDCDVEGPFDAIIGSSVLHHLDMDMALPKIYELLKPGGRFAFAEPNMLNPQVFLERKLSFMRQIFWYVSPDETAFVRWRLANLMRQSGFINIKISPFDWLHPAVPAMAISPVRQMGQWLERLPGLREFSGSLLIEANKPNV